MKQIDKNRIRELITQGKLEEVFQKLLTITAKVDRNSHNQTINLKNRYANLRHQKISGMLTTDDFSIQNAKIIDSLLEIIDYLPDEYSTTSKWGIPIGSLLVICIFLGVYWNYPSKNTVQTLDDSITTELETDVVENNHRPKSEEIKEQKNISVTSVSTSKSNKEPKSNKTIQPTPNPSKFNTESNIFEENTDRNNVKSISIKYGSHKKFTLHIKKSGQPEEIKVVKDSDIIELEKGTYNITLKDSMQRELLCNPCEITDKSNILKFNKDYKKGIVL